jgi:hypothetical protein
MFRIATVVLFAASLCSLATAQAADGAVQKNPIKQAPDNGTVVGAPVDPKPPGSATLKMAVSGATMLAYVHSSEPGFVGVVGLSLTKDLTYSFGLPPLLTGAVVMAFGATDTQDLGLKSPLSFLAFESITLFGQALVIDEKGLWSSNVVGLTIAGKNDGTEPAPANGPPVNADQAAAAAIN